MSRLLGLYPEPWRARYGDEFLALLEDRPPSLRERLDIVRGALDAHMDPQIPAPEQVKDRAGLGALAGFVLFYIALAIALNGPEHVDEYGSYRDGAAAAPVFVLAMLLLLAALFRTISRLPTSRSWTRAVGSIGLVSGLLWSMAPWLLPILAVFLVGVAVIAIGAYRAGLWPTWLPVIVVACITVPLVVAAVQAVLPWYALRQAGFPFQIVFLSISGIWLAFGIGLLRGFRRVANSPR
jgi:hypothetical protein